MGKTTRWFRSLLGYKKSSSESSPATSRSEKEKKPKWGLSKSSDSAKGSSRYSSAANTTTTTTTTTTEDPYLEGIDANKHAIAVAAATAAVAEAALAAAHAAAEVVRLTSGSRNGGGMFATGGGEQRRELAAIKIQSAFRAYLARRALRALKGLVKLQALVRGRIVRKQSADMLRRMQAMARIQARACATRAYSSDSSHSTVKSSQFRHPGNATPKRYDHQQPPSSVNQNMRQMQRSGSKPNIINHNSGERTYLTSNWLDRWMEDCTWSNQRDTSTKHGCGDDDKNDKILEIDTWKPHQNPRQSDRNFRSSQYFSAWNDTRRGCSTFEMASRHPVKYQNPDPSLSSGDVSSLRSIRFPPEVDQVAAWNVENSPQVHSANSRPGSSSRRGGFSPSRSECARSFFGDYISYPNYMANTESSRAKFRSQSAPKQRLEPGKFGLGGNFVRGLWDADTCSEKDSTSHFNYGSKGYSGSARLDRLGTPIRDGSGGFSSSYGVRR